MASPTPSSAIPAPSGQVSDFSGPNQLWQWNILSQVLCLGIPGIMFLMRVYVRYWIKREWILEDHMTVLSYVSLVIYGGILTVIIYHGGGVSEWDLHPEQAHDVLYWANVVQIWYGASAAFIKATILLLYLRVFTPRRWTPLDYTIRVFIVIVVLFPASISVAKIFECTPRARIWNNTIQGTCIGLAAMLNASGIFNIIFDVVILLVPIPALWKLKVERKKKIGIYLIFTVGVVWPTFSIVGLIVRLQHASSPDQTYNQPIISLYAMGELATGMMIICLPTIPSLFQKRRRDYSPRDHLETGQSSRYAANERYYRLDRSRVSDHERQLSGVAPFELAHMEGGGSRVPGDNERIINEIRGGYLLSVSGGNDNKEQKPGEGILKTVTVEHRSS